MLESLDIIWADLWLTMLWCNSIRQSAFCDCRLNNVSSCCIARGITNATFLLLGKPQSNRSIYISIFDITNQQSVIYDVDHVEASVRNVYFLLYCLLCNIKANCTFILYISNKFPIVWTDVDRFILTMESVQLQKQYFFLLSFITISNIFQNRNRTQEINWELLCFFFK